MNNNERYFFYLLLLPLFAFIISLNTSTALSTQGQNNNMQQQQQQSDEIEKNTVNQNMNFSDGKFDWEGGSFPYDENEAKPKDGSVFYRRAVLVAPIVGTVFIIILVIIGVYVLRQYEIPECNLGKDVENVCNNCSKLRTQGLHNKLQNYVMRLFDISTNKHKAFFIQMDPRSRTVPAPQGAHETLV